MVLSASLKLGEPDGYAGCIIVEANRTARVVESGCGGWNGVEGTQVDPGLN
jgi:hypothetical protein